MRWHRDPRLRNEAWLRGQYVDARRSQRSIARQLDVSRRTVRTALARFGIERPVRPAPRLFTDRELVHRYVELGQSGTKIAAELGVDANRVYRRLSELGIERRVRLDVDRLRARYLEDGATLDQIAAEMGCGPETVRRALERAGVPRRGRGPQQTAAIRARLQTDWLQVRYVDDGATLEQIAAEVGCSTTTVGLALQRAGIPRRASGGRKASPARSRLDAEWLRTRYVEERATLDQLAAEAGCSSETVRRALQDAGIARRLRPPRR